MQGIPIFNYTCNPTPPQAKIKKILNQATATRLAVHIQHRPHPTPSTSIYTSPQPGDSNAPRRPHPTPSASTHIGSTSHIQHSSIHTQVNNLTPSQPRTPKKKPEGCAEGPCFMAPLRFSSFPTKTQKISFYPHFPQKFAEKLTNF